MAQGLRGRPTRIELHRRGDPGLVHDDGERPPSPHGPSSIRSARPRDRRAIHRIHVAAVRALAPVPYDEESVRAWAAGLTPSTYSMDLSEVLLALRSREVVGFGWLDGTGELGSLYVHPDHWRRGHGRSLLLRLEDRARAMGAPEVRLRASMNAIGFYRANGYREVVAGWLEVSRDRGVPIVQMAKGLER